MNINIFELALDRLRSSDWEHFEKFASSFLAQDFPSLRTMASPSGDRGRDAELFSCDSNPIVAIQYSVAKDWNKKINDTVNQILKNIPDRKIIIYLTNQIIGAKADKLRQEIMLKGLMLDIRDRTWFLERYTFDDSKFIAAEQLVDKIARPYLEGEKIIEKSSYSLTSQEARAALLYLGLQLKDDASEKGLTKLSYEALVRASLRHTNSEKRISRDQIYQTLENYLPTTDHGLIRRNIDSTLHRLNKRYIRHWQKEDKFCLTYEESLRLEDKLADREHEDRFFSEEIIENCTLAIEACPEAIEGDEIDISNRVKRIINNFLFDLGESFASTVIYGDLRLIGFGKLKDIIINDISKHKPGEHIAHKIPDIISGITVNLLTEPSETTQKYLRCLADSYTLFAFLQEVPDVQNATKKIFSYGEIWIDNYSCSSTFYRNANGE